MATPLCQPHCTDQPAAQSGVATPQRCRSGESTLRRRCTSCRPGGKASEGTQPLAAPRAPLRREPPRAPRAMRNRRPTGAAADETFVPAVLLIRLGAGPRLAAVQIDVVHLLKPRRQGACFGVLTRRTSEKKAVDVSSRGPRAVPTLLQLPQANARRFTAGPASPRTGAPGSLRASATPWPGSVASSPGSGGRQFSAGGSGELPAMFPK